MFVLSTVGSFEECMIRPLSPRAYSHWLGDRGFAGTTLRPFGTQLSITRAGSWPLPNRKPPVITSHMYPFYAAPSFLWAALSRIKMRVETVLCMSRADTSSLGPPPHQGSARILVTPTETGPLFFHHYLHRLLPSDPESQVHPPQTLSCSVCAARWQLPGFRAS